ncbi:hypothetical protein [Flavonifractor plautii]|jgi:V/A-type H+/Na+-transporting ATPase subunit C|nr:V-type ATPase subunit [Flavonifractor plautii]QIA32689.1 V-type ATPase subunit [Flavonifractor plautii]
MTYGALSAKIRALYGKRLRADDFARLAGLKNEAELLEALRQHPGWSRALSLVPPGAWSYVGRVEMEGALRDELRLEYRSLSYYVPREDKPLMQFQLRAAERSALLAALRRLKTGRYAKEPPPTSAVPLRLRLDEGALASCTSYDQLLDAARDTIYAPVLRHLRPSRDGALPDFTLAEAALRTAYFSHLYRIVHRQYTGRTQKVLLRALGEQIDLLNIIHVLRLKTYFPQTEPETYLRVLFPFHYRLNPDFTRALCAAPGVDDVFALLRDSPYRDCFDGVAVGAVEEYYQRAICRFNKRQLTAVPPSIYTAVAYLELKELELSVLINVIESVKYGVSYRAELADLVGQ